MAPQGLGCAVLAAPRCCGVSGGSSPSVLPGKGMLLGGHGSPGFVVLINLTENLKSYPRKLTPCVIYLFGVFLLFGNFSLLLHYLQTPDSGEELVKDVESRALPRRSLPRRGAARLRQPLHKHLVLAVGGLGALMQSSAYNNIMGYGSDAQAV